MKKTKMIKLAGALRVMVMAEDAISDLLKMVDPIEVPDSVELAHEDLKGTIERLKEI